jgi:tRNA pseudouridine55 synthase
MADTDSGLLLLDKPSGPSSFDCVRQARRILQQRRIGHCGTLDPIAQGVLLLVFGQYTRRQAEFLELEKQYWFRAEFGRSTDSGDRTGATLERRPFEHLTRQALEQAVLHFIGDQWQIPPKVSAIKYQGKRLYEWAREGVEVPRPPRRVTIRSIDVLQFDGAFWEARVMCSRGTYIRSLAEDVAARLGTVATVDALVRERVGEYRRENAVSWEQLCGWNRDQLLEKVAAFG